MNTGKVKGLRVGGCGVGGWGWGWGNEDVLGQNREIKEGAERKLFKNREKR